jgi:hypothetical protein
MLRRLTLMLTLTALVALVAAPAASAAPPSSGPLTIPVGTVTGTIDVLGQQIPATVTDAVVTITEFDVQGGELIAMGTLSGLLDGQPFNLDFAQAVTQAGPGASCDILTLDIGAIFLDLLGLQVDIAPISVDITAVPGAGNLLGNLLCAVAGLLDGPSPLAGLIDRLLGLINGLLG